MLLPPPTPTPSAVQALGIFPFSAFHLVVRYNILTATLEDLYSYPLDWMMQRLHN
jgi:hypothetical protein